MIKFLNKNLFLYASLAIWLLVASILSGLTEDVATMDQVVNFDNHWANIFISWRSDFGTYIFSIITLLGNWQFILPVFFVILYILYSKNKKQFIIPFAFTVISAETITFIGKLLIHRERPLGSAITELDFSFPSGHATIAVAFYGFLAYIFLISLKNKKQQLAVFIGTLFIILIIGVSRLYLGVHYISDILAGYLVGSLALVAGVNLSEWFRLKSNQKSKR